jgi:putative glutamine amidotransferase
VIRPLIGLTSYRTTGSMTIYNTELASLPAQYLDTVTRSGGTCLLLPPQDHESADAEAIVSRLDGLIVTGGADIEPSRYGQERDEKHEGFETLRDAWEESLLTAAIAKDIPILGICRGAQMLNVHLGGTLHQHLPDVVGHDRYRKPEQGFSPEPITVEPDSVLGSILGADKAVMGPVQHHQAIDTISPELVVSARGFDGVVQAVERPDSTWCLAVQWHPEEDASDDRIVEAFIAACSKSRA